jgi:hypothetical protein
MQKNRTTQKETNKGKWTYTAATATSLNDDNIVEPAHLFSNLPWVRTPSMALLLEVIHGGHEASIGQRRANLSRGVLLVRNKDSPAALDFGRVPWSRRIGRQRR